MPVQKDKTEKTQKNYLEPCETSNMEVFTKIFNGFRPSTQIAPSYMLDRAFENYYFFGGFLEVSLVFLLFASNRYS